MQNWDLGTHMINLPGSRRDLPIDGLSQITIITVGNGGLLLSSTRKRKPNLWSKHRWDPFPNQSLQGNRIRQSRDLERSFQSDTVTDQENLRLKIPISSFASFKSPPNASLIPHFLSNFVQHIHVVDISFHGEPVQVLEFDDDVGSSGVDARTKNRNLRL